jgi:uncharacterized protein (DUF1810 family)
MAAPTRKDSDPEDPFRLGRFLEAQGQSYDTALSELRAGEKRSHWIWYVFPQLRGLGHSDKAQYYGITSLDEARAYLADPILGKRLHECVDALLRLKETSAEIVLGHVDALKLRSSLTLFRIAAPGDNAFVRALDQYFGGKLDPHTITLLEVIEPRA